MADVYDLTDETVTIETARGRYEATRRRSILMRQQHEIRVVDTARMYRLGPPTATTNPRDEVVVLHSGCAPWDGPHLEALGVALAAWASHDRKPTDKAPADPPAWPTYPLDSDGQVPVSRLASARAVRLDAVSQLIALAGPETYDPALMASRRSSLDVLRRRALDRGHRDEVDRLWPLAVGDTAALIDATQEARA